MKPLFTLIAMALMGISTVSAQNVTITKTDGTTLTFKSAEIKSIAFNAEEADKVDTTLLHEFKGYLLVSTKYFKNAYYGNNAMIAVYQTSDKKVICTFHDDMWGDGSFDVKMGRTMTGTGKLAMADPQSGKGNSYEATLNGTMTDFCISLPGVMGGTTINWIYGIAPESLSSAGKFQGTDSVNVGGKFPYKSEDNVTYEVKANADSTISLIVPEVQFKGTVIGDLTIGSYTIPNIAYDKEAKAFVKAYKDDNVKFHFKAVNNGETTMDNDYTMDKEVCKVVVTVESDGSLKVQNTYQMGKMPFVLYDTFVGVKK
jgi:hypothetical protein